MHDNIRTNKSIVCEHKREQMQENNFTDVLHSPNVNLHLIYNSTFHHQIYMCETMEKYR